MNSYTIHKLLAIFSLLSSVVVNYYLGVGNSLYMMLLAIYFQLCAMEYAEKEQVQA